MDILTSLRMLVKYKPNLDVSEDHWVFGKLPENFTPDGVVNVLGIQTSKDALNINLFCKIPGIVTHDGREYQTHSFVSVPIVKYGKIKTPEIKLEFAEEDKAHFISMLKENPAYDPILLPILNDQAIDLTNMPIINYSEYITDVETLSALIASSIALEIESKALKFLVKEEKCNNHGLPDVFNNDGSVKLPYTASSGKPKQTLFNSKVRKMTIPSVNSVIKKVDAGKKLNEPEQMLYLVYSHYKQLIDTTEDPLEFKEKLDELNGELQDIRSEIMLVKASHEFMQIAIAEAGTVVPAEVLVGEYTSPINVEYGPLINQAGGDS